MNDIYNKDLRSNARLLRNNMTQEEKKLWYDFLRILPIPVKRQKIIGYYIVDFYIPSFKIVIEIDGSQHYEEDGLRNDAVRDRFLCENGYLVLRYDNSDINHHFESVYLDILNHLHLSVDDLVFPEE